MEDITKPIHVMPINDLREHEFKDCWCNPTYDEENHIYIHHSMDKREEYENGRPLN